MAGTSPDISRELSAGAAKNEQQHLQLAAACQLEEVVRHYIRHTEHSSPNAGIDFVLHKKHLLNETLRELLYHSSQENARRNIIVNIL